MINVPILTDVCIDALNVTDATRCEALKNCTTGGIIPYQSIYYCSPALATRPGTFVVLVVLGLWLAVLFMSLAHVAEVYLTSAMGTLAQNLKLPPRLAGVTLLAWANGAPDISANVAAMRAGNIRMALGSAIGAGLFVTCLIGGRLAHMARSMRVKGAMVRDILVYALAVTFLLFAHTTSRITAAYVAVSLFAYAAFLLAVLAADLHHRGHMPYQRRRGPRAVLSSTAKPLRTAPRFSPPSPRIPASASPSTTSSSPRRATAPPPSIAHPIPTHPNAFFDDSQLRVHTRSASTSPSPAPSPTTTGPFQPTLLPISGVPPQPTRSEPHVHPGHLIHSPGSIQHVMGHTVHARATSCAAHAHAILKPLLSAPPRVLQLLQFSSIPQRPKGAGVAWVLSGVHPPLLLRLTLAAVVVLVYFRHRLSPTTAVVFACSWAGAVAAFAGVWWAISDPTMTDSDACGHSGFGCTGSLCDADIQMQELEVQRARPVVTQAAMEMFPAVEIGTRAADLESAGVVYPAARPWRAPSTRAGAVGESARPSGWLVGFGLGRGGAAEPEASYPQLPPSYDDVLSLSEIGGAGPAMGKQEGSGFEAAMAPGAASGGPGLAPDVPEPMRRAAALALAAVLSVSAFGVAVLWVQLVAEELVAVLGLVGAMLRLDRTLLGVTLLAWGNCSADLVSNTALARSSRLSTAMSAVYAGPLLDVLVAVPVGYAYVMGATHRGAVAAEMPLTAVVGAVILVAHLFATLAIAAAHGWVLPAWFWKWGAAVYAAYMVALVTMVALGVQ